MFNSVWACSSATRSEVTTPRGLVLAPEHRSGLWSALSARYASRMVGGCAAAVSASGLQPTASGPRSGRLPNHLECVEKMMPSKSSLREVRKYITRFKKKYAGTPGGTLIDGSSQGHQGFTLKHLRR